MNLKILNIAIVATIVSFWANDINDKAYERREALVKECRAEFFNSDAYVDFDICRTVFMTADSRAKYADAFDAANSKRDISGTVGVVSGFIAFFAFIAFLAPIVWRFLLARLAEVAAAIRGQ